MEESEYREWLIQLMLALLRRLEEHIVLVEYLRNEVHIPAEYMEQIMLSARQEMVSDPALESKFRTFVESAPQSAQADLDTFLASFLQQWKPQGKPN